MVEWIRGHVTLLWWVAIAFLSLLVSVVAGAFLLARLPPDYFTHRKRRTRMLDNFSPPVRVTVLVLKNILGYALMGLGVALLVLPGQGVLTLLMGLVCVDFPGKFRLERWLVRRPSVLRALNWLRAKMNQPPLQAPRPEDDS